MPRQKEHLHNICEEQDCLSLKALNIAYPKFKLESQRIASFKNWPKALKQKPEDLADAGFFYTGTGDHVTCFYCGGCLIDWEETDTPWEQHAIWYSNCQFIKLIKGVEYVERVLKSKLEMLNCFDVTCGKKEQTITQIHDKDENFICKICYNRNKNTVFMPCGHIFACMQCALSIVKCPYCKSTISKIMKIYL